MQTAALIAIALIGALVVFQLALALGAPYGAAAWGGRNPGVLPPNLRIASAVVGIVVYPLMAVVILAAAGLIGDDWLPIDPIVAMWILTGFFALGAVVNALSPSAPERVWSPVSAVLAICCALIAVA
jgi:hypothetical protein